MTCSMTSRRGSMIIYCLSLSTVLVVLGYGFLSMARSSVVAGDSSTRTHLAQSAARLGLAHALEQIAREQAGAPLPVATGAGASVMASPAPTFLDGPWRAPFVSLTRPNEICNVDHNQPVQAAAAGEPDDVRAENPVVMPLLRTGDSGDGYFTWFAPVLDGEHQGNSQYDGRGRWIEAEFHEPARPDPASDPRPVATVRFTDRAPTLPARAKPLLLDRAYGRIDGGDAIADRLTARYRLRYAVGVEDLGGHLLANPDSARDAVWAGAGGMQPSWRDPAAAYRTPPAWLAGAQHAWYNMARRFGGGTTSALRAEHVFLGRGNSVAADRHPTDGFPTAFPGMLRNQLTTAGAPAKWWGYYATAVGVETGGLYPGTTQAGGQHLGVGGGSEAEPLMLGGYGPQLSWLSHLYAQRGNLPIRSADEDSARGIETAISWGVGMFALTPYGQRLERSTAPPATWRWYQGRVDTPWHVNLLTAAPMAVDSMIWAYLPPGTKMLVLTRERYYEYTPVDGVDGWNRANSIGNVTYAFPPGTEKRFGIRQRDLFTRLSGDAFRHYAPPASASLDPDFQTTDARPAAQRYPGALWWAADDLGDGIDVNQQGSIGKCSKTGQAFHAFATMGVEREKQAGSCENPAPPAGFDEAKDLFTWDCGWGGGDAFKAVDSYYADLIGAFTQAIAIARAAWSQYPCRAFAPSATSITPALRDPLAYDSLEEIDRLFLRQLGENFDAPGDGIPLAAARLTDSKNFAQIYRAAGFTPNATIRTLVVAGRISARQANVMERVLNDWRMSFLGAGPQYSELFRPLDFSGDGETHSSAYEQAPGASPADLDDGVAWWKPATAGRGPAPDHWFSLTGCFNIGRSHHFRIFTRGELFDNVVQKPVADATLESVVAADPEGTDSGDLRILFQRWHYNRYTGELPRQLE